MVSFVKKLISLIILIGVVLVGCQQDEIDNSNHTSNHYETPDTTKDKVYNDAWDGKTILVKQGGDEEAVAINEIDDAADEEALINELKNADWRENIDVDIRPPDYYFVWNAYKHKVWINEETSQLELSVEGQSNFVTLSKDSSNIVFEILTNNPL